MRHGIDLEDNHQGDGSRTKRLDHKDFDALMGGPERRWSGLHVHLEGEEQPTGKNDHCPHARHVFSS
jgi:hypothetical protein